MDDRLVDYMVSDEGSTAGTGEKSGAGEEAEGGRPEERPANEIQVTVQELIIWDAWMNWEENLRWAHHNRMLAWAIMTLQLPWDHPGIRSVSGG